jgi:hypothetical protein
MLWIERFERIGRLVLWLSLASVCVIIPIEYVRQHKAEVQRDEAVRAAEDEAKKAEAKLAEQIKASADKSTLLSLGSMGEYLTALNTSNATGQLWFTNVSARAGVVCVYGVATNPTTHKSVDSMAACQEIGPYASAVHVGLMFPGGDLNDVCPNSSCSLSMKNAPEPKT